MPHDSPLSCLLKNWTKFDLSPLKKNKMIFFGNVAWPQYKLDYQEVWPTNGTLNLNAIVHLDLFCQWLQKWSEVLCPSFHGPESRPGPPKTMPQEFG